jgi:hypothetical protein
MKPQLHTWSAVTGKSGSQSRLSAWWLVRGHEKVPVCGQV